MKLCNGSRGMNEFLIFFRALGLIVNAKLDLNTFYEDQSVVNDNETFNEIPFQFRRYKDLLKSHFQENPERYSLVY